MPEPKTPKFGLLKGGKTPVSHGAKAVSLTSFMKFAQEISMMEQGLLKPATGDSQVTDLSSLKPETSKTTQKTPVPCKNSEKS